jgi:hypothetical protein
MPFVYMKKAAALVAFSLFVVPGALFAQNAENGGEAPAAEAEKETPESAADQEASTESAPNDGAGGADATQAEAAAPQKADEKAEEPKKEAPAAKKSAPPPSAKAPDHTGETLGEWKVVSARGPATLPDGRALPEVALNNPAGPCGYIQPVVAERNGALQKGTVKVGCKNEGGKLVPDAPSLDLETPRVKIAPQSEPDDNPKKEERKRRTETPAKMGREARDDPETQTKEEDPNKVPFLKGELTRMGTVQLVNARQSAGVQLGATAIDNVYYLEVSPDLQLKFDKLALGFGFPLRFEVANLNNLNAADPDSYGSITANAGRFRTEDWDQIEDFLRPLRYATWGRKEDRLYVDVNRVHPLTIGHGQLVRRYTPNLDIDEDNLFAAVDAYADFGGVELMAGPFPIPRLFGGLLFVKPLGAFREDTLSRSLSTGFSFVADVGAPTVLARDPNPADGRMQLAVDKAGNFIAQEDGVYGLGLDTEVKLVKWEFIDLKVYGDYSHLLFPAVPESRLGPGTDAFQGGGFTVGSLLRMSFGEKPVRDLDDEEDDVRMGKKAREKKAAHAVRVRVEGRAFDPQYLPSYFNTLYELQKFQFGFSPDQPGAQRPTKIAYLAGNADKPWRLGHHLEASYLFVDWVGLTAMYEDATAADFSEGEPAARNVAFHVESAGLGFLQLFGTYHYRAFEDWGDIFSFGTANEFFTFGGRLQLLPILFINAGVQRTFKAGFGPDDNPEAVRALSGQVEDENEYHFSSVGLEPTWRWGANVEFGWQF